MPSETADFGRAVSMPFVADTAIKTAVNEELDEQDIMNTSDGSDGLRHLESGSVSAPAFNVRGNTPEQTELSTFDD